MFGIALILAAGIFYWAEKQEQDALQSSFTQSEQSSSSTATTTPPQAVLPITPSAIAIPTIDVFAEIEHVGINQAGNMEVPSSYQTTAWFELGFRPGENGNAIIAGHVNNSLGLPGIFIDLDQLVIGDEIIVQGENSEELKFVVTEVEEVDFRNAPIDEIYGPSDTPQIRLITCSGNWLPDINSYDNRLIVTATLKSTSDT